MDTAEIISIKSPNVLWILLAILLRHVMFNICYTEYMNKTAVTPEVPYVLQEKEST